MNLANILPKSCKYLLACSFGPDSMSLFHMLLSQGYNFEVAHVNYGLRDEAKNETECLSKYCKDNNIKIHILFATVDRRKNMEAECRNIRYSYFASLNRTNEFDAVLVAHNEDDLFETYLMQKNRNIYAKCYGISQNTTIFGIKVIRPLLSVSKNELEKYCLQFNVPFAVDSSNFDISLTRNNIRHNVIKKLTINDRQQLLKEIENQNASILQIFEKVQKLDLHNLNSLINLNENEFIISLNMLYHEISPSSSLSKKCCYEIREILNSKKPNVVFKINHNVSFVKEYSNIYFVSNKKEVTYHYNVENPCIFDNENMYFDLSYDLSKRNLTNSDFPLTIRTYMSGDCYQIKNYSVLVRRLFIDWKMPLSIRKKWPIIVNKDGVIKYIPRYRADFDIKSSPDFFVKI